MKTKLKKLVRSAKCLVLSAALCAVGLSAWAEEPDAVQLWKDGPYFATCNVGADTPEGYGILTNFNDAAQAVTDALGSDWHLPSDGELKMLAGKNNGDKVCSNVWTTCNGVAGRRFFGMTPGYEDKNIFLPAAGYDQGNGRESAGDNGRYWSSELRPDHIPWYLFCDKVGAIVNGNDRSYGLSVRAVRYTPPTPTPPEPSDEEVVATAEATFVLGPALAVANVKTATHWPWDGKIDVTCDLTGMGNVQLSAALTTNGVTVCTATAENVTGETEIDLDQVGGVTNGVKFTWDAKADCPADFNSTDTKVKVSAKKVPKPLPVGALPGEFTVSATKKVHFSQGNLYYDGSNWGFEEEQYYFRTYNGKGKCDANGYSTDSGTASGHWGLFGWSTEGKNFGMSTSISSDDYSGNFRDWGTTIDNKGTWTTLSGGADGEWKYLFDHHVNVWGTCNNVPGLFIAPDGFVGDESALSEAIKDWESAETAGIVFLPAAGSRKGAGITVFGTGGRYYSSSSTNDKVYLVSFTNTNNPQHTSSARYFGYSVRLVTEVK